MKKFTFRLIIPLVMVLMAGCATVEDVRQASDLIRTDNELTRILQEDQTVDGITPQTDLSSLAIHAKSEADALKSKKGKTPDAIAYYRIAATAYWKIGKARDVNTFFEVVNTGSQLCLDMGDKAPDRDCLFLGLVIPFAGLEEKAAEKDLAQMLDSVKFTDDLHTPEEIETMGEIRAALTQTKPLVQTIFAIGKDNRLFTHPGMREYYCNNAKTAQSYFSPIAAIFETRVIEYHNQFDDDLLGIDPAFAGNVRKLDPDIPEYCR